MIYNNNQTKDTILDYIKDSRHRQAILVDGDWGSGKTHFIENTIIPAIESTGDENDYVFALDPSTRAPTVSLSAKTKLLLRHNPNAVQLVTRCDGTDGSPK